MDFWTRLFGVQYAPRKAPTRSPVDSQSRFHRFRIALLDIERICSNKRDLAREEHTLGELQKLFEKLAQLIRDETRAPIPHPCVQHAANANIFVAVNRAAAVSFHEGCIRAAISLMAALVDSEEESFLASTPFAKSLMRLVTRVVTVGDVLLSSDTETLILELLFTISAKIRLQPEILPSWFSVAPRIINLDVEKEEQLVNKEDFPLCYILVDRIYHDGRIGDFARTGLLYIFEATGNSEALAQWIVGASDVPTLMATGLGALYSQLSRELSILYPDSVLPATLALSDYTTTQSVALAESAFSERHIAHMTTFLSYLAFWQDILDHCRSQDVQEALLDHFQILFLQQLLYPSILESSDRDGGSSVAVLSYLTAILESLEHPSLTDNIMSYLMAAAPQDTSASLVSLKRRRSLLQLSAANGIDELVEPTLFNLVDLLQNSLVSSNAQTLFSALRLTATISARQPKYVTTLLAIDTSATSLPRRSLGTVRLEIERYIILARRLHDHGVDSAFDSLTFDLRHTVLARANAWDDSLQYLVPAMNGAYLDRMLRLLETFFSNSVEVNLALTEALVAIACSPELRLDGWLCLPHTASSEATSRPHRAWQRYVDPEEEDAFARVWTTLQEPTWPLEPPRLYAIFKSLVAKLDTIRQSTANLDTLISGRKNLLQAASVDATIELPPSMPNSPGPSPLRQQSVSSQPVSGLQSPAPQTRNELLQSDAKKVALDPGMFFQPPPVDTASTTDVLMKNITFDDDEDHLLSKRQTASLNHVLTNAIVLQEFILEVAAILSIRASVLGDAEVSTE